MGSPPREWEHSEDILEAEQLFTNYLERNNINIIAPPVPLAIPIEELYAEDPVSDAVDEDDEDYENYADYSDYVDGDDEVYEGSPSSSIILVSSHQAMQRSGRFSDSYDSDADSIMGFPIDPPAGSPVGFPIESPMDSLATSPETSPESSVMGSPVGSRATSPIRCPATTSASTSLKRNYDGNSKTEDEAFSCSICLDTLTNTGLHRPACLKCGHIFGENCLQRWIKTGCNRDAKRCPTCNRRANVKDIRVLYAKNLIAVDTAEVTALELKVEKV
ncbi:PREDICTED: uncharacterized protein LOC107169175 [Diuraphis noxia]|uniref:uncharacterized protein LOC107169175 n=1 Tax=Diuraphis noxia TaxID=143948 RepID=UPI0007637980|nr:PREDICTED: uncharacterized protein LOC107169175 [Diuraphis noxia]